MLLAAPPGRLANPRIVVLGPGDPLLRIDAPAAHDAPAAGFRRYGPLLRFDHHRAAAAAPEHDDERGVLYCARTLVCCVAEVFGDRGVVQRDGHRFARLAPTRELRLLDLRETAATAAGTIPAIGSVGERELTQAWARWWYEQPELGRLDGVIYSSAQCGHDAVALWERADGAVSAVVQLPLDAAELADELVVAAAAVQLAVV
ncbi:RES family NAD+ phosphorylase [Conexibacter stalactiti]|uniref:RES family NAD+ phosphorylase n=1 Tax=Conexibacter stalactiti TaxID=1940611 RepID=A0ABU4HHS7_9ACTN|nr:RES family NAD+ phosphorylase [Conexibacter stalactiti]MDW5592866.1 RES family NAD+ phosphorylase [Conexibacter stalactiti]MEC5033507.1 RES family NAD+ phosphorylase [Conexibacter stalactiti]